MATPNDEIVEFSPFYNLLLCTKLYYDPSAENPHKGCDPDQDNTVLTNILNIYCLNTYRLNDMKHFIKCGPYSVEGLCLTLHQFITLHNLSLEYIEARLYNLGKAIGLCVLS